MLTEGATNYHITSYYSHISQTINRRSTFLARSAFVPKSINGPHLTWRNGTEIKLRGSYDR